MQMGATTLEVPAFHITLPALPNQWSSAFHLRAPSGLQFTIFQQHYQSLVLKEPMAASLSSEHSTIYRDLHLRLAKLSTYL
jgi:hypothetical protein